MVWYEAVYFHGNGAQTFVCAVENGIYRKEFLLRLLRCCCYRNGDGLFADIFVTSFTGYNISSLEHESGRTPKMSGEGTVTP